MDKINEFWESLSPTVKKNLSLVSGIAVVIVLVSLFVIGQDDTSLSPSKHANDDKKITPLVDDDIRGISIDRMKGEVERMGVELKASQQEIKSLRKEVEQKRKAQLALPKKPEITSAQIKTLIAAALKKHDTIKKQPHASKPEKQASLYTGGPVAEAKNQFANKEGVNPFATPVPQKQIETNSEKGEKIRVLTIRTIEPNVIAASFDHPGGVKIPYLPMGSIITGVLLNGIDAGTGAQAQKRPQPVLVRVKKEAILPNRFSQDDIRECFILASGWGELSSERVHIRSVGASCVKKDGAPIEVKVNMFAVGEDGKAGLRGVLVNKQGQLLAKSLMAGIMSGFSSAFSQNAVPTLSLSPGNQTPFQSAFSKESAQSGLVQGTSSALDRLAQFYINQADQLFPVLEVDAGRRITFVVERGFDLRPKDSNTATSISSKDVEKKEQLKH